MGRVAGICYIKVDGEQLEVSGGVECPLMEVTRETVMGTNGPAGHKETAQRQFVKVSAVFTEDFPMNKVTKGTDMTVTAEMPNGKVYTLSGAYLVGEPTAKADDGITELEFDGKKGQWQ